MRGAKKGWQWKVTDDQLAAIREMQAAGKKISRISKIVGLPRPTIYRILGATRRPQPLAAAPHAELRGDTGEIANVFIATSGGCVTTPLSQKTLSL